MRSLDICWTRQEDSESLHALEWRLGSKPRKEKTTLTIILSL
jgi:hypothetical protein